MPWSRRPKFRDVGGIAAQHACRRRLHEDSAFLAVAFDADRQDAGAAFLLQKSVRRLRDAGLDHRMRAADRRMAGERNLATRREDAQAIARVGLRRREHERRLDEPGPCGERLHVLAAPAVGIDDDAKRIAAAGARREDVELQVTRVAHVKGRCEGEASGIEAPRCKFKSRSVRPRYIGKLLREAAIGQGVGS